MKVQTEVQTKTQQCQQDSPEFLHCPHRHLYPSCLLSSTRDDDKSAAIFKGLGECVPFEGEGDDDGGGSDEDEGPPAKKRRGRPAAGGSKKAAKGSAKKAAGGKKGKGKAKR